MAFSKPVQITDWDQTFDELHHDRVYESAFQVALLVKFLISTRPYENVAEMVNLPSVLRINKCVAIKLAANVRTANLQ